SQPLLVSRRHLERSPVAERGACDPDAARGRADAEKEIQVRLALFCRVIARGAAPRLALKANVRNDEAARADEMRRPEQPRALDAAEIRRHRRAHRKKA